MIYRKIAVLHALWDEVPSRLVGLKTMLALTQQARALAAATMPVDEWPAS